MDDRGGIVSVPSLAEIGLGTIGQGLRLVYPAPIDPVFDDLLRAIDRADDDLPRKDAPGSNRPS